MTDPVTEKRTARVFTPGDNGERVQRAHRKVGRNEPCPCGSGKKFKNCHAAPRWTASFDPADDDLGARLNGVVARLKPRRKDRP